MTATPDSGSDTKAGTATRKALTRRVWALGQELRKNSDFYIHRQAVKGGASSLILSGAAASIIFYMQLPFILAATGIALCIGLAAVGIGGIALAARAGWGLVRDAYRKNILGETETAPKPDSKPLINRLAEHPRSQAFLKKPLVQKMMNSRAGKITTMITKIPQDLILNGLALQGSVFFGAMSAAALAATVLIFPVVALSSLLTVGTLVATGILAATVLGVINGARGTYLGLRNMVRIARSKKKNAETAAAASLTPPAVTPPPAPAKSRKRLPLALSFTLSALKKVHIPQKPAFLPRLRLHP